MNARTETNELTGRSNLFATSCIVQLQYTFTISRYIQTDYRCPRPVIDSTFPRGTVPFAEVRAARLEHLWRNFLGGWIRVRGNRQEKPNERVERWYNEGINSGAEYRRKGVEIDLWYPRTDYCETRCVENVIPTSCSTLSELKFARCWIHNFQS